MAYIFTLHVGFTSLDEACNDIDANRATLFSILHRNHPNGFTVLEGVGCFHGVEEPSASVVLIADSQTAAGALRYSLVETANEYKALTGQEEAWITWREETLQVV